MVSTIYYTLPFLAYAVLAIGMIIIKRSDKKLKADLDKTNEEVKRLKEENSSLHKIIQSYKEKEESKERQEQPTVNEQDRNEAAMQVLALIDQGNELYSQVKNNQLNAGEVTRRLPLWPDKVRFVIQRNESKLPFSEKDFVDGNAENSLPDDAPDEAKHGAWIAIAQYRYQKLFEGGDTNEAIRAILRHRTMLRRLRALYGRITQK